MSSDSLREHHHQMAQAYKDQAVGTYSPTEKTNVLLSAIFHATMALYEPPREDPVETP